VLLDIMLPIVPGTDPRQAAATHFSSSRLTSVFSSPSAALQAPPGFLLAQESGYLSDGDEDG